MGMVIGISNKFHSKPCWNGKDSGIQDDANLTSSTPASGHVQDAGNEGEMILGSKSLNALF